MRATQIFFFSFYIKGNRKTFLHDKMGGGGRGAYRKFHAVLKVEGAQRVSEVTFSDFIYIICIVKAF